MSVFYTLLSGLLLLALLLRVRCPYLLQDLLFLLKGVRLLVRMKKIRSRTPCYTILDCFLDRVKKNPEKEFLVFEGRSFSYQDVDRMSSKVAQVLLRCSELKEGDRVALFLENEPQFVWIWLGLFKLGCAVALLNTNIRSKSLLHCFTCCGAKVLIAGAALQDAVEEVLPALNQQQVQVFLLKESCETDGIVSLSEKINNASDKPLPLSLRSNVTVKDPALYVFTSGTTGLPKAAVINHERIWMALFIQVLSGVRSDDVLYIYLPLYHIAGLLMGLAGAIERGTTVVLRRRFSVSHFWNDCRKHKVTVIQYIGEIIRYLCNTPTTDTDREHNVRLAIGNGLRADNWAEFLRRFGDIRICECYGATEANIGFTNYIGKIGAIGRDSVFLKRGRCYALIKYDTERDEPVRDSRGLCVEVPRGETGLLVSKITKVAPFNGYANNKHQTEKKKLRNVFEEGDTFFNTGDLMKIDQQGFIYFQDRVGDTFRWKGENVATTEVADIMVMADCIEEANVYGVEVPGHEGRIGMATIKLKEKQNFDVLSVYKHVEYFLPSYARPRFIRIQEEIEITSTYKQTKMKLAEEGFDPNTIRDSMYFLDEKKKTYIPMTEDIFKLITDGQLRL